MENDTDNKIENIVNYNKIEWSPEEKQLRILRKRKEDIFSNYQLRFVDALKIKLRKSVFGTYLDILNPSQIQNLYVNENKLSMSEYDMKMLKQEELNYLVKNNSVFNDCINKLKNTINTYDCVEYQSILETTEDLRINDFYINMIESELKLFKNLSYLILNGNNIREIRGSTLPRNLKYLELSNNFIHDLALLTEKPPKNIVYIGLSRNRLTNESSLHLLSMHRNFEKLVALDLADNDIYDLGRVLIDLADLRELRSLQLEGNPCYVEVFYKHDILKYFPQLFFLDNTEVLYIDRENRGQTNNVGDKPQIVFYCHRIVGLKQPPKDRKTLQTIHLEIDMPLLEKIDEDKEEIEEALSEDSDKLDKKGQIIVKQQSKGQATVKNKEYDKISNPPPYDKPNEYEEGIEKKNFSFKTDKMPWSKIIEFPPVLIQSPEDNKIAIRDSLKSCVTIRIIYLKEMPMSKPNKPKKNEKTTKNKIDVCDDNDNSNKNTILEKITLGSFKCTMTNINWSDTSNDFYWADHDDIGNNAISIEGCLKNVIYKDKKEAKKAKAKKTPKVSESSVNINVLPTILTCQVGFGLLRSHTSVT